MAKQSFVTGQVLTAQQVNDLQTNDFNQTVSAKTASYTLVAADKGTRITMSSTSATTITINTGLFAAGDTVFIQNLNTGVSTITAGTATVSTSATLALAQHEGGTLYFTSAGVSTFFKAAGSAASGGGMTLIDSGSLSGASLSLDVSGEQSYNDLILDISGAVWSAGANVGIRVNGLTTSYGYVYYANSGGSATNQASSAGETYWIAGDGGALPDAADTFKRYRFTFPMYALTTGTIQMFGFYSWGNANSTRSNGIIIGSHATADNIDTIIFRTNAGQTFSAGTYKLFGVK